MDYNWYYFLVSTIIIASTRNCWSKRNLISAPEVQKCKFGGFLNVTFMGVHDNSLNTLGDEFLKFDFWKVSRIFSLISIRKKVSPFLLQKLQWCGDNALILWNTYFFIVRGCFYFSLTWLSVAYIRVWWYNRFIKILVKTPFIYWDIHLFKDLGMEHFMLNSP